MEPFNCRTTHTQFLRAFGGVLRFSIIAATVCVATAFAAGEPTAEELLREHGLERIGHTWCLPAEAELRLQLSGLERFEPRLAGAQQSVDQIIGQNELCKSQMVRFEQLAKQAQSLADAAKQGTAERGQLAAQAKQAAAAAEQWKRQYIPPKQFGMSGPLKPALADLVNVRTDLAIRLLTLREEMDRLKQSYDALKHDDRVKAAIGPQESLGPTKTWRDGWKIVDKLQPMVLTDSLPVVREGQFYRVTAIVGERQPLTFSYMGTGSEPTLIPQNLAEAAGLAIDKHAPKIKLRFGKREETAWRTKVPQLRFGRHVLHDVEAYILAPEAADLGARISAPAFAGYRVQLDPDRLLLTISK